MATITYHIMEIGTAKQDSATDRHMLWRVWQYLRQPRLLIVSSTITPVTIPSLDTSLPLDLLRASTPSFLC